MATFAAVEDADLHPSAWLVLRGDRRSRTHGASGESSRGLAVLGVCAVAAKEAWEIEDQGRTGPLVRARDRFRAIRRGVVDRGWHRHRVFGGPLRWVGKRLP